MNIVSVVKSAGDVKKTVRASINLIGGLNLCGGENVVIKPNICNSKNPEGIVNTDIRVIKAVVELVKEKKCSVTIVESDNISGTADKRVKESGYLDFFEEWGVDFFNLSRDSYHEYPVAGTELRLPLTVLDSDYFVNMPKIKTCAHTLVTLSIKNLYGVFQRKQKGRLHRHLDEILPFLAKAVRNDLVVVDGLNCMEGNGPVIGNPLCLDLIVSGRNIVSVDSVCSRLMGYNPLGIPHIALSAGEGVGPISLDEINVVGDNWEQLGEFFEPPYSLKAALRSLRTIRNIYLN